MTERARILMMTAVLATACTNAGENRVLAVGGTGLLGGVVYLDRDGDRTATSADAAFPGVRVRLLVTGTRDTVATATSGSDGVFSFGPVPVGRYTVVVPGEPAFGDSVAVVRVDTNLVDLEPADTLEVQIAVSFPLSNVPEARTLALGTRVFITGTVLNFRDAFADTILHVRDTAMAIRITRTQGPIVAIGDTVRVLGTVAARDGQPVLDVGQVNVVSLGTAPAPVLVDSTGHAALADGGRLDGNLVTVVDATITDTMTVNGDYVARVDDGSGELWVVFDQDLATLTRTPYVPGVVIDATGLLIPDGTGLWRMKPRLNGDLVVK